MGCVENRSDDVEGDLVSVCAHLQLRARESSSRRNGWFEDGFLARLPRGLAATVPVAVTSKRPAVSREDGTPSLLRLHRQQRSEASLVGAAHLQDDTPLRRVDHQPVGSLAEPGL